MTVATDRRMTLKEYLTYEDGTAARYELVDGVLVEMGAESRSNIKIALFLIQFFLKIVDYDRLGIKEKIEVQSHYATARDPDLIIHSEDSANAIEGRTESCLFLGEPNPLIVIEVVSPGTESKLNYKRDYEQKPIEYADRGIPELWQVDAIREWVKVGTLTAGAYQFTTFRGDETIVSPTFPELNLTAAQILGA
jgi:Uma2 family endonuclease